MMTPKLLFLVQAFQNIKEWLQQTDFFQQKFFSQPILKNENANILQCCIVQSLVAVLNVLRILC